MRKPTLKSLWLSATVAALAAFFVLLSGATSASATTVAAAGDISCPEALDLQYDLNPGGPYPNVARPHCQGTRVARMIADNNPYAVLALGDLVQEQHSLPKAYEDFDREWGPLTPIVFPTVGNHDYYTNENGVVTNRGYFNYWDSKDAPRWKIGDTGDGWTSWDMGTWHMIDLNSNCRQAGCAFTDKQMEWLKADLSANRENPKTKCIAAYFHHPLFSAGASLGRTGASTLLVNAWELLYRYRTDLVLNGHQHFYERYAPQNPDGKADSTGIREFILGTGGASTFHVADDDGNYAENSETHQRKMGATFFDFEDNSYGWQFKDLNGKVLDSSEQPVQCHSPNEGANLRAPRARRYNSLMRRLRDLGKRIEVANGRLSKTKRVLEKARAGEAANLPPSVLKRRIKVYKGHKSRNQKRYDKLRVSRLYPKP